MQEKISKLQEEVAANQDNTAQKIVKKLKVDHRYRFWKKGHEQQLWFKADINEHIQKVWDKAGKIEPSAVAEKKALDKLKIEHHKGSQRIVARLKRIKVADRLDFGWAAVELSVW